MSIKTYLFHEISSYLPLLEGEEFDALVEDIKQFGQIEPAVLFEGKIIDGRNRYRACKQLGIELKVREWKPSELTGMTPLQFVISENIMRRHLNVAQRAEIGILLLEEEKRIVGERMQKIRSEIGKASAKEGIGKTLTESKKLDLTEKISEIKEEMGEGKASEIVGAKVKISDWTLEKAKKIKEVAKEDKKIAEKWEEAKKGKIGVDAVYKKVQEKAFIKQAPTKVQEAIKEELITVKEAKEVVKLPEELQDVVIKPRAKTRLTAKEIKEITELPKDVQKGVIKEEISIEDAKSISEIEKPDQRKRAIQVVKKMKTEQKDTVDYMKDVAKGKEKMPTKTLDLDMKIINQFTQIYKQVVMKMTKRLVDSYNKQTRVRLLKIMKEILIHLQRELNIKGEIIEVEKS